MQLMILGLVLFLGAHLALSVAAGPLAALRTRLGQNAVKGMIALPILAGLVLIVLGWRSATAEFVYAPPFAARGPAMLLVVVSVYLFAVSNRPSALKRIVRHPQLTGVVLFSIAHLLLNGDSRSVTLFSALGVWAVVSILTINRRDGARQLPAAPPMSTDIVTAVIALIVAAALAWAHPWIAGVAIIP